MCHKYNFIYNLLNVYYYYIIFPRDLIVIKLFKNYKIVEHFY